MRKGVPKRVQVLHKHRGQLRWGKRAERQHNTGTTGKTSVVIPKRFTTGGRRLTGSRAAKRTISYDVVTDTGLVRGPFAEVLLQELAPTDLCSDQWLDGNFSANQQKVEDYIIKSNPYRLIMTLF